MSRSKENMETIHDEKPNLLPTLFQRPDRVLDPLYVIAVVFNPIRYRTRWKLAEDFLRRCEQAGAIVYLAEVAFGHRQFVLTQADNPRHLQLQTGHELWLKENVQNLLIQRLPLDAKYIACMDADIALARDDWANATIQELQHYAVVQMWSQAQDLDPSYQMIQRHVGFGFCYVHGTPAPPVPGYYYGQPGETVYWHPGYCWAYRREALDYLGGLIDICILGSADHHMAHGLIGKMEGTLGQPVHWKFKNELRRWQERAEAYIRRNIGYVPGTLIHYYHGSKAGRRYIDRWKILTETQFNPDEHLKRDWQGVWQLTDKSRILRDRLKAYSRQRDEDAQPIEGEWGITMGGRDRRATN